jgi:hypothetical protein
MINDQQLLTTLALTGENAPSIPLNSVRYRVGLQQLHGAFNDARPLVVLTGSSTTDTSQLVSSFLDGISSDVTVVRIGKSCSDPLEGMREVVRATGFLPREMNLVELDIMFMKFLSLQRFHHQRTIFVIEESPHNEDWIRDKVRNLVELEKAGNFGLMVLLSRESDSDEVIDEPILGENTSQATNGRPKKMRKLFPTVPLTPMPKVKNGARPDELKLNTDDTVPINIILSHQNETMHELTLEQPRLMIGRAEDNDLCINNTNVSRHHAILVRHGAAAMLMDMNSTNGTFVNSQRIKDQVVVHNDIISIGNHQIKYIAPSGIHSGKPD